MKRQKNTKKALFSSILSLVICLSMLIGATFAWFTDSVTSANNIIKSGNLDVEMFWADGTKDPETVAWKDASEGAIFDYDLWEPGYVCVRHIKISNEGSLALKYVLDIEANGEVSELQDVIDVYYVDPAVQVLDRTELTADKKIGTLRDVLEQLSVTASGKLLKDEEDVITLALKMQESAGNYYQDKSIGTDFSVKLFATQATSESDSFDNTYDSGAYLPVVHTVEQLKNAIANGESVKLGCDMTIDASQEENGNAIYYTGDKSFTIDLNGFTLTGDTTNVVFRFQKAAGEENTITIKNGKIVATDNSWSAVSVGSNASTKTYVNLANLEISSCKANDMAVRARAGAEFTITNCDINATNGAGGVVAGGGNVTLNNVTVNQSGVYNYNSVALGVSNSATMTVNSGSYNSDPEGNAKGNWVAYVMSSGGNLLINGGNFNGTVANTANAANACGLICADRAAVVKINGGTFQSNGAILDMRNNVGTLPNPVATIKGGNFSSNPTVSGLYASNLISIEQEYILRDNGNGTYSVVYDGAIVSTEEELSEALANGEKILLAKDISYTNGIVLGEGASIDGGNHTITYTGTEYDYQLVKLSANASVKNVTLENYRVRTENATNGVVTLENVVINMDNDQTGLDISRGAGTAKLTNVTCKGTTDAAHLDPNTTVQVDYTPYGDVLLGTKWGLEAVDCAFGSLHGWNTTNGSSVSLTNTTTTVFRMHYWSNRTLYINGVETAWSESGAIPVAHDVGGCWSVQPAFK